MKYSDLKKRAAELERKNWKLSQDLNRLHAEYRKGTPVEAAIEVSTMELAMSGRDPFLFMQHLQKRLQAQIAVFLKEHAEEISKTASFRQNQSMVKDITTYHARLYIVP